MFVFCRNLSRRIVLLKSQPKLRKEKLNLQENYFKTGKDCVISNVLPYSTNVSTTSSTCDKLMEFFDDKKYWDEQDVKVGRAWTKDDLRIKSNEDLHKLWYVLLKERNMLLTMEHECKQEVELFPSPERIDKVNISMENLQGVVQERNRAYFQLETGESGERPAKLVYNQIGMKYWYRMSEHFIPKVMNRSWREKYKFGYSGAAVHKFLRLYREKIYLSRRKERGRDFGQVVQLIKKNPNIDLDTVREHYPTVDLVKALRSRKSDGHHEKNV